MLQASQFPVRWAWHGAMPEREGIAVPWVPSLPRDSFFSLTRKKRKKKDIFYFLLSCHKRNKKTRLPWNFLKTTAQLSDAREGRAGLLKCNGWLSDWPRARKAESSALFSYEISRRPFGPTLPAKLCGPRNLKLSFYLFIEFAVTYTQFSIAKCFKHLNSLCGCIGTARCRSGWIDFW